MNLLKSLWAPALRPYSVLIVILLVALWALAFTVDITVSEEAGIQTVLPDQVGEWRGSGLWFCQNYECATSFTDDELAGATNTCSKCTGTLDRVSFAEKEILPADTFLRKKQYTSPAGEIIFVSLVLSGKERTSIHRPEECLVGQGNEVVAHNIISVPLPGRAPLDVMLVDIFSHLRDPRGRPFTIARFYAYWFVGKDRETPSHARRLFWMAYDRVVHNVAHRWAYVAVSGVREMNSTVYQNKVAQFIKDLYPQMVLDPERPPVVAADPQ